MSKWDAMMGAIKTTEDFHSAIKLMNIDQLKKKEQPDPGLLIMPFGEWEGFTLIHILANKGRSYLCHLVSTKQENAKIVQPKVHQFLETCKIEHVYLGLDYIFSESFGEDFGEENEDGGTETYHDLKNEYPVKFKKAWPYHVPISKSTPVYDGPAESQVIEITEHKFYVPATDILKITTVLGDITVAVKDNIVINKYVYMVDTELVEKYFFGNEGENLMLVIPINGEVKNTVLIMTFSEDTMTNALRCCGIMSPKKGGV